MDAPSTRDGGRTGEVYAASGAVTLSAEHLAGIRRQRRIIVHFDVIMGDGPDFFPTKAVDALLEWKFTYADDPAVHIDSMWWDWDEGHRCVFPSKVRPLLDAPAYRAWADAGMNIVRIFLEASQARDFENFYLYRINGSDTELGRVSRIPMKEEHPDWLIHTWRENGFWNFAVDGVHEYKLRILRELAEDHDFDGIALDFARNCPVLPPGRQWELRDRMTEFMRKLRTMLLEIGSQRGRPLLLAVRIPENLMGCHFDGLDVETWARELLVDLMVMGCRSFDVDVIAFRRITSGTPIKLYASIDDHHSSDGYMWPPIEVFRGVFANWWHQGVDGIQTFNWEHAPPEDAERLKLSALNAPASATHHQAYREMHDPENLRRKDKVFVVQRRGGGHGPRMVPNPEDWTTPRWMYSNTNMFGQLPAPLAGDGRPDTLLSLYVADDLVGEAEHVDSINLRVLLSDPATEAPERLRRLPAVKLAEIGHPHDRALMNRPPSCEIERHLEVRVNNARLEGPHIDGGWLVFPARPELFAVGENLVGVRLTRSPRDEPDSMLVEKLELHVRYHAPEASPGSP